MSKTLTPIAVLLAISLSLFIKARVKCDEQYSSFIEHHPHTFVDKSQSLVTFFNHTSEPYNFITCPRNFGKTFTLNMIKTFAQIEVDHSGKPKPWNETRAYDIFGKLYVASHSEIFTKHLAQHPVICVNLQFDSVVFKVDKRYTIRLMTQLKHTFTEHQRICDDFPSVESNITEDDIVFLKNGMDGNLTKDEIKNSLYRLSEILYNYFNKSKVILLVDGYDTAAILGMVTGKRGVLKYYEFLHEMLTRALQEGAKFIEYALVAAITSVSYYSVDYSKINILKHRPFLDDHPFTSFCGLLEQQAVNVFNKHYCDEMEKLEIKKHYNGYTTLRGTTIYDPNSLTRYFDSKFRTTRSYWRKDIGAELMYDFLHFNDVYETLSLALLGDHSFESDFVISKKYNNDALYSFTQLKNFNYTRAYLDKNKCVSQILTFVFEQGYLSHMPGASYGYRCPNQQIRTEILDVFKNFTEKQGSPLELIV